jgi:predicted transcriptional regulator
MMPEVDMTALGTHLASARRQQHLRQADLAREVGIHEVTLSRIENGKLPGGTVAVHGPLSPPSPHTLVAPQRDKLPAR